MDPAWIRVSFCLMTPCALALHVLAGSAWLRSTTSTAPWRCATLVSTSRKNCQVRNRHCFKRAPHGQTAHHLRHQDAPPARRLPKTAVKTMGLLILCCCPRSLPTLTAPRAIQMRWSCQMQILSSISQQRRTDRLHRHTLKNRRPCLPNLSVGRGCLPYSQCKLPNQCPPHNRCTTTQLACPRSAPNSRLVRHPAFP